MLIGGLEDGEPRLYETDPSGTPYEWKAIAIGSERSDIQAYLEDHYDEDQTIDEAVDLALRALASVHDEGLTPNRIAASTVDAESERYIQLTDEELEEYLADADLLADEE